MSLVTQLQKLTAFGRGICTRLYDVRLWQDRTDILFFTDPRYVKLNRILISKYPAEPIVEKQATELYQRDSSQIVNDLLPWFYVLVDTANYLKTSLTVMTDFAEKTNPLKFNVCPYLFEQFHDLFVLYFQIIQILPKIDHKRILTVFGLCHKIVKGRLEDNHKLVMDFFATYSTTEKTVLRKLREEFKPISKYIVTGLLEFSTFARIRTASLLRKEGIFSIINPQTLDQCASNIVYNEIRSIQKIYNWLVYGTLLCPEALKDVFAEIIRVILLEGPFAPGFREQYYYISKEVIALTKTWRSKEAKPIKDAKESGLVTSGLMHKEMRIYLRYELGILLNLCKDTPSLLAPKFEMILSALALSKYEVLWFFRHYKEVIKSRSFAKAGSNYDDNRITSLIYDLFQFTELICDHTDLIRDYYIEFLYREDLPYLKEVRDLVKSTMNQDGGEMLEELIQVLTNIESGEIKSYDFESIRQQWYQAQLKFVLKQSTVLISKINDIIPKINQIMFRTRIVDSLPLLLSESTSLRELWYSKEKLQEIFERSIADGPDQPTHCSAYLAMLGQFPENATAFYPDEQEMIGKEVVQMGENFLNMIIERIRELLNSISSHAIQFNSQAIPQNAIFVLAERHEEFAPLTAKRIAPPEPASESAFRNRPALRTLQLYQRNLPQLCCGLNEYYTFVIYDKEFTPVEYFAEAIQLWLRKFCHKIMFGRNGKERFFQPPALFIRQIHYFISVLKDIEHYVSIDIRLIISTVMLSEVWSDELGASDRGFEWIKKEQNLKIDDSQDRLKEKDNPKTIVDAIVQWYYTFVTTKLAKGTKCEETYSPVRNGFVSKRGLLERGKPEAYCDLVELSKLCELIGPVGVKLIDRDIIRWLIPKLKELEVKIFFSLESYSN